MAFADGSMIEFITAEEATPDYGTKAAGIRHIAIGVEAEAFDLLVITLKADSRVQEISDVVENAKGIKTYFFRDPEGNILHLIYRPVRLI
mgnify:CR=1 FL=1